MKKASYLVLTLAAIAMLSFSSCKKECTCVATVNGVEVSTSTVETKGKCADESVTSETIGVKTEVKCN